MLVKRGVRRRIGCVAVVLLLATFRPTKNSYKLLLMQDASLRNQDHPQEFVYLSSNNNTSNKLLLQQTKTQNRQHAAVVASPSSDAPFSFSACLIVKDESRILPEWLAYHYTFLPLRRLIVSVDPLSETDPSWIFNLYRDTLGMNITIWYTNDFVVVAGDDKDEPWQQPGFDYSTATEDQRLLLHQHRQKSFYQACMNRLKQEGYTWTALIDADEFIAFNDFNPDEGKKPLFCSRGLEKARTEECAQAYRDDMKSGRHPRAKIPAFMDRHATMAEYIASGSDPKLAWNSTRPCMVLPSILYTSHPTREDLVQHHDTNLPAGFDPTLFHTFRYRQYTAKQTRPLPPGKCIYDVSQYDGEAINSVHKVSIKRCFYEATSNYAQATFRIHHHVGSLDTFLRPGYDSRGIGKFIDRNKQLTVGVDNTMQWWLPHFVELVGSPKQALLLTQEARIKAQVEMEDWRRRHNQTERYEDIFE